MEREVDASWCSKPRVAVSTPVIRDIRFAIRSATRNPALTAVIVISLALGIGANTTIFTLINAVFLRPLPVNDPARLAQVFTVMPKSTGYQSVSLANYRDFRDNVAEFSGLAASKYWCQHDRRNRAREHRRPTRHRQLRWVRCSWLSSDCWP